MAYCILIAFKCKSLKLSLLCRWYEKQIDLMFWIWLYKVECRSLDEMRSMTCLLVNISLLKTTIILKLL
jgi:hypothetical protein